jgi:taurine dioxygenase
MDSSTTLRQPPQSEAGAGRSTREVVLKGPGIGAEIRGVDVAKGLDDETFAFVFNALHEYSVVVLRDQDLTPAEHVAFTRRLGEMRVSFYNRYGVHGQPELSVVSNIKREDGEAIGIADAGMLWHTDASYLKTPDMYTVLYGLEIPERDGKVLGDTVFTSAWQAYEALPEAMKKRVAGMRATHSFIHHLDKKKKSGNLKRAPLTEKQKAELPDVDHPIVRTHPVNGRPCLFVTEGHTSAVVGLAEAQSDALLGALWTQLKDPAFHYRHSWRKGDLIVWDNCAVHHLAIFDYGEIPRRLHRAGILGPVPF